MKRAGDGRRVMTSDDARVVTAEAVTCPPVHTDGPAGRPTGPWIARSAVRPRAPNRRRIGRRTHRTACGRRAGAVGGPCGARPAGRRGSARAPAGARAPNGARGDATGRNGNGGSEAAAARRTSRVRSPVDSVDRTCSVTAEGWAAGRPPARRDRQGACAAACVPTWGSSSPPARPPLQREPPQRRDQPGRREPDRHATAQRVGDESAAGELGGQCIAQADRHAEHDC